MWALREETSIMPIKDLGLPLMGKEKTVGGVSLGMRIWSLVVDMLTLRREEGKDLY